MDIWYLFWLLSPRLELGDDLKYMQSFKYLFFVYQARKIFCAR